MAFLKQNAKIHMYYKIKKEYKIKNKGIIFFITKQQTLIAAAIVRVKCFFFSFFSLRYWNFNCGDRCNGRGKCVCVCFCHSQVGQWRQIFEGSFWYQRYVVAMERPGRDHEISGRTKKKTKPHNRELELSTLVFGKVCETCWTCWVDTYNKRRDLSPSKALTGIHRRRL